MNKITLKIEYFSYAPIPETNTGIYFANPWINGTVKWCGISNPGIKTPKQGF